jgi:hypothetical protein
VQWAFVSLTTRNSAVGVKGVEINSVPGRLHPFVCVSPLSPTRHDVEDLLSFTQRIIYVISYVWHGRQTSARVLLDGPRNSGAFQILRSGFK